MQQPIPAERRHDAAATTTRSACMPDVVDATEHHLVVRGHGALRGQNGAHAGHRRRHRRPVRLRQCRPRPGSSARHGDRADGDHQRTDDHEPADVRAALSLAPGSPITFSGTATDDEGLQYVEISLRNTTTREKLDRRLPVQRDSISGGAASRRPTSPAPATTGRYTTPFNLKPGTYSFSVRATDDLGLTTSSSNQGRLTINAQVPGDARPTPG